MEGLVLYLFLLTKKVTTDTRYNTIGSTVGPKRALSCRLGFG